MHILKTKIWMLLASLTDNWSHHGSKRFLMKYTLMSNLSQ